MAKMKKINIYNTFLDIDVILNIVLVQIWVVLKDRQNRRTMLIIFDL